MPHARSSPSASPAGRGLRVPDPRAKLPGRPCPALARARLRPRPSAVQGAGVAGVPSPAGLGGASSLPPPGRPLAARRLAADAGFAGGAINSGGRVGLVSGCLGRGDALLLPGVEERPDLDGRRPADGAPGRATSRAGSARRYRRPCAPPWPPRAPCARGRCTPGRGAPSEGALPLPSGQVRLRQSSGRPRRGAAARGAVSRGAPAGTGVRESRGVARSGRRTAESVGGRRRGICQAESSPRSAGRRCPAGESSPPTASLLN